MKLTITTFQIHGITFHAEYTHDQATGRVTVSDDAVSLAGTGEAFDSAKAVTFAFPLHGPKTLHRLALDAAFDAVERRRKNEARLVPAVMTNAVCLFTGRAAR